MIEALDNLRRFTTVPWPGCESDAHHGDRPDADQSIVRRRCELIRSDEEAEAAGEKQRYHLRLTPESRLENEDVQGEA